MAELKIDFTKLKEFQKMVREYRQKSSEKLCGEFSDLLTKGLRNFTMTQKVRTTTTSIYGQVTETETKPEVTHPVRGLKIDASRIRDRCTANLNAFLVQHSQLEIGCAPDLNLHHDEIIEAMQQCDAQPKDFHTEPEISAGIATNSCYMSAFAKVISDPRVVKCITTTGAAISLGEKLSPLLDVIGDKFDHLYKRVDEYARAREK